MTRYRPRRNVPCRAPSIHGRLATAFAIVFSVNMVGLYSSADPSFIRAPWIVGWLVAPPLPVDPSRLVLLLWRRGAGRSGAPWVDHSSGLRAPFSPSLCCVAVCRQGGLGPPCRSEDTLQVTITALGSVVMPSLLTSASLWASRNEMRQPRLSARWCRRLVGGAPLARRQVIVGLLEHLVLEFDDVLDGVDQRQVGKCLREIAQVTTASRFDLLGIQLQRPR